MLKKYSKIIVSLILIFIIIILSIFISNKGLNKKEEIIIEKKEGTSLPIVEDTQVDVLYKVDIKGEVISPGVYDVSLDERVIDLINKAGGLTDNADTSNINLSKKLKDEMVVIISNKEEIKTDEINIENDASLTIVEEENNLISINSATKEELMTLSGIGESKANAIIEYRNKNKFNSIEDIKKVNGIGQSLYEKIKDYITV